MTAAAIADAAARRRVLVVGSPPPGGRDLDLLVRPEEEAAIAAALEARGFLRRGTTWARFDGGTADVVDLIPAAEWGRGDVLFDEGVPLDGHERLVVPAPHHDLLLAATRFLRPSGRLKEGRTRRLAAGPARDPRARWRARAEAPAWDAEVALERLEALLDGVPRRDVRGTLRALPDVVRRRRGVLVRLSGPDPSATRAQAEALAEALDRLGYAAVIEPPARGVGPVLRSARHLAAGRVVITTGTRSLRLGARAAVKVRVDGTVPFDELAARSAELVWGVLD